MRLKPLEEDGGSALSKKLEERDAEIARLKDDVEFYSKNSDMREAAKKVEQARQGIAKKDKEMAEMKKHVNHL